MRMLTPRTTTMNSGSHTSLKTPRRHQRGQAVTEYIVVAALLALMLFLPVPGSNPRQTVGQMAAESIHQFYKDLTFALSLP